METKKTWVKPELIQDLFKETDSPPKDPGTSESALEALS